MQPDKIHIKQCIEAIETKLGWGSGARWTHQDFLNLSDQILEETGEPLSYITLKRVWGKVTYHSVPNPNTLNTLARFLGYHSWRAFQNNQIPSRGEALRSITIQPIPKQTRRILRKAAGLATIVALLLIVLSSAKNQPELNPEDFQFSSKKVISQGIPNSVIFDIDAHRSPYDSVEVQQSWNTRLRTKIPKEQTQHTSIYYYPGFFQAKLLVGGEIVREHPLHITTNGWYCAVEQEPVPVYFPIVDMQSEGKLELTYEQLHAKNISLQPRPPVLRIGNSRDFGDLKTDNFIFEAKVKNTYREGSAVCQNTRIFLLCEGAIIAIPLMAKGCVSSSNLTFVDHVVSGKEKDLSAFGVDFSQEVLLRIECIDGKAIVSLDGTLAYTPDEKIRGVAIKGIDFRFEGLGSVDEVKLGRPNDDCVLIEFF